MEFGIKSRIFNLISRWLSHEPALTVETTPLYNFERLSYEIRPGDVILVEGRSKVSDVIKMITQSPWTHSALYIGRLYDLENDSLRDKVAQHYQAEPGQQLIVEALLSEGTVVYRLEKYKEEHLRICRPKGLSPSDAQKVIAYAIDRLGTDYNVRQLLDLARFLFPYGFLPRRWRSSLFTHHAGDATRTVCSTMLAQAFQSVKFPLIPFAEITEENKIHLYQRNPKLYTPKDFDYSPYFDIVKYPFFGLDDISIYRHLPWKNTDMYCNDINDCYADVSSGDIQADLIKNTETKTLSETSEPIQQDINLLEENTGQAKEQAK